MTLSVAVLAVRIQSLQTHLLKHKKDNPSKRGLEAMLTKQRKLLKVYPSPHRISHNPFHVPYRDVLKIYLFIQYLKRKDFEMYRTTVTSLNLVPV